MIRRFGVVFILYPIFILCYLLHFVFIVTCAIWGPIYYIITGLDPLEQDTIFFFVYLSEKFWDWYIEKFGPNG